MENFTEFQNIAKILETIKSYINEDSDTIWAGFDTPKVFLDELDKNIEAIKNCDYDALDKVNIDFAPTCTYQELSISNGWSNEYINLSSEFDNYYKIIKNTKTKNTIFKYFKSKFPS